MNTTLMPGVRLGTANTDGLVVIGSESRGIGKRIANEDGRNGDGGGGKKRRLRPMLRRETV